MNLYTLKELDEEIYLLQKKYNDYQKHLDELYEGGTLSPMFFRVNDGSEILDLIADLKLCKNRIITNNNK